MKLLYYLTLRILLHIFLYKYIINYYHLKGVCSSLILLFDAYFSTQNISNEAIHLSKGHFFSRLSHHLLSSSSAAAASLRPPETRLMIEMQSELPVNSHQLCRPLIDGRAKGGGARGNKHCHHQHIVTLFVVTVGLKSGTQLHSSFSELFHTVKPTDSNEC